jgi:hypothetical protein
MDEYVWRRLTPSEYLRAIDALLTANWQLIEDTWPNGQLLSRIWRTLVLADISWLTELGNLIAQSPPTELVSSTFNRRLIDLRWDVGCNSGSCWMRIYLGTKCFVEAERRYIVPGLVPRMSPLGNNYSTSPWTKWEPLLPLRDRGGRLSCDFPTEKVLGTIKK